MRELSIDDLLSNRYLIVSELGQGSFGRTYIAQDMQQPSRPQCVVKQLKPEKSDPRNMETALRLFETEAKVLERLGKHTQIPQLLAHFTEGGEFFVVQELIKGDALSKEFIPGQAWSGEKLVRDLQDILKVLSFVHSNEVIHRDIKPDNIIRRSSDSKLVLVDFGSVKQISGQVVSSHSQISQTVTIGTIGYMSTEQGRGRPRPSSDIYSLGMIAIQALTGLILSQLQDDVDTGEVVWKPWARGSTSLIAIIEKMTRYHFKDRYQSTQEVLEDLENLAEFNSSKQPVTSDQTSNITSRSPQPLPPSENSIVSTSKVSTNPTVVSPHSSAPVEIDPIISAPKTPTNLNQALGERGLRQASMPMLRDERNIDIPVQEDHSQISKRLYKSKSLVRVLRTVENLRLAGFLGTGSWLIAVGLASFLSTIWLVSGAWLVAVGIYIFGLLAREKDISDKVIWMAISIACTILTILVLPGSMAIESLLKSGLSGWLVVVITTIFSYALAFILLSLFQFVSDL